MPSLLRPAVLAVASLLLQPAYSYIYSLEHQAPYDGFSTQIALVLTEGAMYPSHQGPFGTDGVSEVLIEGTITATPAAGAQVASSSVVNLWSVVFDDSTRGAIGRLRQDSDGAYSYDYCCTPVLYSEGLCGPGIRPGGLILYPDLFPAGVTALPTNMTVVSLPDAPSEGPAPSVSMPFTAYYEVQRIGRQVVLLTACDASGAVLPLPSLDFAMDATFLNPYGYLPGQVYGLMAFYGVLLVVYVLLTTGFGILGAIKRRYLILLQYCVFGVLALGVVEAAAYHFMYKSKNNSGVPTPCADCGAPTSDYLAAISLSVFKRAFSRALLLAVALGFGVVHPSLSRKETLSIVGLSLAYLLFGLVNDVKRSTTYDVGPSSWELPVIIIDFVFLFWIYASLGKLRAQLALAGQAAKLLMYNRLHKVLVANVAAWFVVTVASILVRIGKFPVAWTAVFLFSSFWDLLYLFVTIAVAIIWAPGESSYQYSYYSQAPGAGAGGVIEGTPDSMDLEAAGGGGSGVSAAEGDGGSGGAGGAGDVELTAAGTTGRKSGRAAASTTATASGSASASARHERDASGDADGDSDLGDELGDDDGEIEISLTPSKGAAASTTSGSAAAASGRRAGGAPSSLSAAGDNFAIDEADEDEEDAAAAAAGKGDRRKLTIQAGPGVDARPLRAGPEAAANAAAAASAAPASARTNAPASGGKGLLAPPRAFAPTAADAGSASSSSGAVAASASPPSGAAAAPATVPGAAARVTKPAASAQPQKQAQAPAATTVDDLDLDDFD